ncbi:hypothetical protein EBY67_04455 [bacterium]|nr:hypothetical protein [bacterium]
MQFAWWIPQLRDEVLIEVFYHATLAKVENNDGILGDLCGLCVMSSSQPRPSRRVRGIFFAQAMVAKDAKFDTKEAIRSDLSGSRSCGMRC